MCSVTELDPQTVEAVEHLLSNEPSLIYGTVLGVSQVCATLLQWVTLALRAHHLWTATSRAVLDVNHFGDGSQATESHSRTPGEEVDEAVYRIGTPGTGSRPTSTAASLFSDNTGSARSASVKVVESNIKFRENGDSSIHSVFRQFTQNRVTMDNIESLDRRSARSYDISSVTGEGPLLLLPTEPYVRKSSYSHNLSQLGNSTKRRFSLDANNKSHELVQTQTRGFNRKYPVLAKYRNRYAHTAPGNGNSTLPGLPQTARLPNREHVHNNSIISVQKQKGSQTARSHSRTTSVVTQGSFSATTPHGQRIDSDSEYDSYSRAGTGIPAKRETHKTSVESSPASLEQRAGLSAWVSETPKQTKGRTLFVNKL